MDARATALWKASAAARSRCARSSAAVSSFTACRAATSAASNWTDPMLGSLTSLAGYLLVLFVITVWMCVKIWRRSPLLAIGAFFLWPLSLIALFLYWGDEDSDIRVPFALSLVVSILIGVMAMRAVDKGIDEMAWMLSDEDIAQIRLEDPKLADQ